MTLQGLAEAASVSVSMLSSVERGQKTATVVVLARIAEGLRFPLAGLVAAPDDRVIVRRSADQDAIDEPGVAACDPLPCRARRELRVEPDHPSPGCDAGRYPAYAAGSHEYVVVESGGLRLTIGDETFHLDAGDSLYFAADVTHGYANTAATPCTSYVAALIMRPRGPDRRHRLTADCTGMGPFRSELSAFSLQLFAFG